MALTEASQIIDSTHGMFLMHHADTDELLYLAAFGEDRDPEKKISLNKITCSKNLSKEVHRRL